MQSLRLVMLRHLLQLSESVDVSQKMTIPTMVSAKASCTGKAVIKLLVGAEQNPE